MVHIRHLFMFAFLQFPFQLLFKLFIVLYIGLLIVHELLSLEY